WTFSASFFMLCPSVLVPLSSVLPPPLLPIPLLEQIRDSVTGLRQQVLAIKKAARTNQFALGERMADFHALGVRLDNPGDLRAAGKEVLEPLVDFRAGIARRQDFHCQIRGGRKKTPAGRFEAERFEPGFGNEGNVRCPAIAIAHPVPCTRTSNHAQLVLSVKLCQCEHQAGKNVFVLKVVLWTR